MALALGTAALLLADIQRLGALPSSSTSATATADILAHADAELREYIVPLLLRCNEEYLTRTLDVTLVAGTSRYELPRRAVGARLRDVHYLRGTSLTHLPRLRPEQVGVAITSTTGYPYGFYMEDAALVLLPAPSAADSLRLRYYVRPGQLETTAARQITSVGSGGGGSAELALGFASYTTFSAVVDITSHQQPFETRGYGLAATSVGATSLVVQTADVLSTPVVGDWVTDEGKSGVVQAPLECHGLLAQRTAARVLQSLGYMAEANAAWAAAAGREAGVVSLLTPRTDGTPVKLSGGLMHQQRQGVGRWRW